ncbi:MAG: hypothetical protein HQK83_07115 [Fibrobacteria bacterium]|nr:hypothetical protein [Fibrobacteria bacterium]
MKKMDITIDYNQPGHRTIRKTFRQVMRVSKRKEISVNFILLDCPSIAGFMNTLLYYMNEYQMDLGGVTITIQDKSYSISELINELKLFKEVATKPQKTPFLAAFIILHSLSDITPESRECCKYWANLFGFARKKNLYRYYKPAYPDLEYILTDKGRKEVVAYWTILKHRVSSEIYPDGIYDKIFKEHQIPDEEKKKKKKEDKLVYPYPIAETKPGPIYTDGFEDDNLNNHVLIPVSIPDVGGGVCMLDTTAQNLIPFGLRLILNGANSYNVFSTFPPIHLQIGNRRTLFRDLAGLLRYLPAHKEIALCVLLLALIAVLDLNRSNMITVLRMIAPGEFGKTTAIILFSLLITGSLPARQCKINEKEIKNSIAVFYDERGAEGVGSKIDNIQEKLVTNNIQNSCKLIISAARSVSSDTNQIGKCIHLDHDIKLFNQLHLDEEMRNHVRSVRNNVFSYIITLLPDFLQDRENGVHKNITVKIREKYKDNGIIRQAENLAHLLMMLQIMEPDIIAFWGSDYTAEEIFDAFMEYQQRQHEVIHEIKNLLIGGIEERARKILVNHGRTCTSGLKFKKSNNQIHGTLDEWYADLSIHFFNHNQKNITKDEFQSMLIEAFKYLDNRGWQAKIYQSGGGGSAYRKFSLIIPDWFVNEFTRKIEGAE